MSIVDRGPFRRSALKSYIARQSRPNPKPLIDRYVAKSLQDQGFRAENDPRSVYDPQQLYDVLERYGTSWSKYEKWDSYIDFGFRMAYKLIAKPRNMRHLQPLSHTEIARAIHMEKSSGLPAMTSKKDDFPYALDREIQIRSNVKHPNPCVAYARTQKGNKTRLVWGYPLEMTIMEARFARPLIDYFKRQHTPMAFGRTKSTIGSYIYDYIIDEPGNIVSLDYSKFDSTVPANFIDHAFDILGTWFTKEERQQLGWNIIKKYFITTPIVMPDGHLYTGKTHGVPSGSYFTQMIDSVVNIAINFAVSRYLHVRLDKRSLYVLGDDAILNVVGDFDIEDWARYLNSHGMIVNTKKTILGRAHFIGAYWDKGMPDAPLQELVNKAVQPERWRDYQGNPDRGSAAVIASYASNYLSAIQMFWARKGLRSRFVNTADNSQAAMERNLKWMSGSDRFLAEEMALSGISFARGKSGIGSPLSVQYLL